MNEVHSSSREGTLAQTTQNESYNVTENTATQEASSQSTPSKQHDEYLITFDGDDDPQDPLNWSRARKLAMVIVMSSATFTGYTLHRRAFYDNFGIADPL